MADTNNKETMTETLLRRIKEKKQNDNIAKVLKPLVQTLITSVKKTQETLVKNTETKVTSALQRLDKAVKELSSARSQISNIESIADNSSNKVLTTARSEMKNAIESVISQIPKSFEPKYLEKSIKDITDKLGSFAGVDSILSLTKEIKKLREAVEELEDSLKKQGKSITKLQGASMTPSSSSWARHESFTMNGSDTSVSLAEGIAAQGTACIVRYQGQTLDLDNQYTVDGNKITFDFTPSNGTTISVTYWS